MTEGAPANLSAEELQRIEDEERLADWEAKQPPVSPAEQEEIEAAIAEFEEHVTAFEQNHSLEDLLAIVDISPKLHNLYWKDVDMTDEQKELAISELREEEVRSYHIRTAAKKGLEPITKPLYFLSKHDKAKADELTPRYMRLSRAVGMINSKIYKIDHER